MKTYFTSILLWASLAGALVAQSATDLNEGLTIDHDSATGSIAVDWWGKDDFYYFLLETEDLASDPWAYFPHAVLGSDGVEGISLTSSASKMFFKLELTNDPSHPTLLADFDGDFVRNKEEIDQGTNPFSVLLLDGEGIPDWLGATSSEQVLPTGPTAPPVSVSPVSGGSFSPTRIVFSPTLDVDPGTGGGGDGTDEAASFGAAEFNASHSFPPSGYDYQIDGVSVTQFTNNSFEDFSILNARWDNNPTSQLFSGIPGWFPVSGETIELHKVGAHGLQSVELAADTFYTMVGANQSFPAQECGVPLSPLVVGVPTGTAGSGVKQTISIAPGSYVLSFMHRGRKWDDPCGGPSFTAQSFNVKVTIFRSGSSFSHSTTYHAFSSSVTSFKQAQIPFSFSTDSDLADPSYKLKVEFTPSGGGNFGVRIDRVELFKKEPPTGSNPYTMPLDEAAGPKYRKIALNGRPLSDEKPQQESESDQEPEETYIDAMTLQLRHSVTDIYIPVPASELSLSVRRNYVASSWNEKYGLRPHERPDLPFGLTWSTNVTPIIKFNLQQAVGGRSSPDTVVAYDENGEASEYAVWYSNGFSGIPQPSEIIGFFPMPSDRHEQQSYLNTLSLGASSGEFILKKRFGTEVTYTLVQGLNQAVSADRLEGSTSAKLYYYARATEVKDRVGNRLIYEYKDESGNADLISLIPSRIYVADPVNDDSNGINSTGLELLFSYSEGRIDAVSDPHGNVVNYTYLSSSQPAALSDISGAEGHHTKYVYDYQEQSDALAALSADPSDDFFHKLVALKSIEDSLGNTTVFSNSLQHGYYDFSTKYGYYEVSGRPLQVAGVDLSGLASSSFSDESLVLVDFQDNVPPALSALTVRKTYAIDTLGNRTSYTWYDPANGHSTASLEEAVEFKGLYGGVAGGGLRNDYSNPFLVYFPEMQIDFHEGSDAAAPLLGTERYTFDSDAGMALSSVVDFSGNLSTFEHGAPFTLSDISGVSFTSLSGASYPEPTSERRYAGVTTASALLTTKHFRYENTPAGRIMTAIRDPEGRLTQYDFDITYGRRTSETIFADSAAPPTEVAPLIGVGSPSQITDFLYPDNDDDAATATWPTAFMTAKVVRSQASDPSWASDLTTAFIPVLAVDDSINQGRIASQVVDPAGLSLSTDFYYDRNGNRFASVDPRGFLTLFEYDGRNRLTEVTYPDATSRHTIYDPRGNRVGSIDENGHVSATAYDALNRKVRSVRVMGASSLSATSAASAFTAYAAPSTARNATDLYTDYGYNSVNSLESTTDSNGNLSTIYYDALQRVTATQSAAVTVFDSQYEPSAASRPLIQWFIYGENSGGSAFDGSSFKPTAIVDARGYLTAIKYDALYRPVATAVQFEGTPISVSGQSAETTPQVTLPSLTTFGARPSDFATTWTQFDDASNPVASIDPLGIRTETTYDALNRPQQTRFSVTSPGTVNTLYGYVETLYTSTALPWSSRDALGRITETEYDTASRPERTLQPAVFDARTQTTQRPITQTAYDANGNSTSVTNPRGFVWDTLYDERNRPIYTIAPAAYDVEHHTYQRAITQTHYDNVGNPTSLTDARGHTSHTFYDAANRPTQNFTPQVDYWDGSAAQLAYLVSETLYDANSNITHIWQGAASAIPQATPTPGSGYTRTKLSAFNTYDTLNRLRNSSQDVDQDGTITSADITVENLYDAQSNRTAVIDGKSQRTEFLYDALSRNVETHHGVTGSTWTNGTRYTFDAIRQTDRYQGITPSNSNGQHTAYDYDSKHRLLHVDYAGNGSIDRIYTYDQADNILSVDESGAQSTLADVAYTYDNLNRIQTETSAQITHNYRYDLAGNRLLSELGTPEGGTSQRLITSYDSLNRTINIVEDTDLNGTADAPEPTSAYFYDFSGNILEKRQPNGHTIRKSYDPLNRVSQIAGPGFAGQALYHIQNTYDAYANLAQIVETYPTGQLTDRTISNTYDGADRLTHEVIVSTHDAVTTTYGYDTAHNRLSKLVIRDDGTTSTTLENSTNLCNNTLNQIDTYADTISGKTLHYHYDSSGNRDFRYEDSNGDHLYDSNENSQDYLYDYENRLTQLIQHEPATSPSLASYNYAYDYRTRRVLRDESAANGETTYLSFSGGTSAQEYQESGSSTGFDAADPQQVEYIRGSDYGGGIGGILYTLRNGTPSFKHYNSRGDVVAATDAAGALTYQAAYEAFGQHGSSASSQEWGATNDRQQANTKDEDPTGLLNEGHRYRDLETGTFITRDPLGFVDGPNVYTYVVQNPWTYFDPLGLKYEYDYQEKNDDDSDEVSRDKQTYNNKLDHIKSEHDKVRNSKYYEGSAVQKVDNDLKNTVSVKVASGNNGSRHGYGKGDTSVDKDDSITTTIYINPTRSAKYDTENGMAEASTAEKFVHESTHALDLIEAFPNNAQRWGSWLSRGSLSGDDFVKYPSMFEKRAVDEANRYRAATGLDQRTRYADPISVDYITWQKDPVKQESMRALGRWNSAAKAKEAQGYQMGIVGGQNEQRIEWRKK